MHGSNRWFGIGTPPRAALLVVLTVCLAAVGSGMGAAAGAGATGTVPSAGSHGAMTSTPVGPTTACGPVGGATGTGGASTAPADVTNHWVKITSPEAGDTFHRGDVVPIDLSFQDNATGTVTVGGEGQPITLDVTVEDADRNGRASVYLNTFQIGNETRDHGAFAVDEGTEIVNVSFQAGEVAPDGPGGDGVVPAGSYDLAAVAGAEPARTAPESDRHTTTLELADRETGSTTIWTAPRSADHLLDATTVDEIDRAIDEGIVTPANGTIAGGDLLVAEIRASGLEGLLHEAALQEPEIEEPAAFLDREIDHDVTDPLFAAGEYRIGDEPSGMLLFSAHTPWCRPWAQLDHANHSTALGGTRDAGGFDKYYVVMKPQPGLDTTLNITDTEVEYGDEFITALSLYPIGDPGTSSAPPLADENETDIDDLPEMYSRSVGDVAEATVEQWVFVKPVAGPYPAREVKRDIISVTNESGVDVRSTTSVAAGTNLTVSVETLPGQDAEFAVTRETTVEYVPGPVGNTANGTNRWGVTLDLDEYPVGTRFQVTVTRTDTGERLTPEGEPIQGMVAAEPRVDAFEFQGQRVDPEEPSYHVARFDTTHGGFVTFFDETGKRIGQSDFQPPWKNTTLDGGLYVSPERELNVTAVAYRAKGQPYLVDGDRVERTATLTPKPVPVFEIRRFELEDARIDEPLDVNVSVVIENAGDEAGTEEFTLRVGPEPVEHRNLTLSPGESMALDLTIPAEEFAAGETNRMLAEVDESGAGREISVGTREPHFDVRDVDVEGAADGPVTVTVFARNTGDQVAIRTVELRTGDAGRVLNSTQLYLQERDGERVTMTVPREVLLTNGTEMLTVTTGDDTERATVPFDVGSAETPTATPTDADRNGTDATRATDDDGAGFGVLAAMLALLAATGLAAYRRE